MLYPLYFRPPQHESTPLDVKAESADQKIQELEEHIKELRAGMMAMLNHMQTKKIGMNKMLTTCQKIYEQHASKILGVNNMPKNAYEKHTNNEHIITSRHEQHMQANLYKGIVATNLY